MTILLIIPAACVASVPLALLVASAIHKDPSRSTNSLGAATPQYPAAEGTGARPALRGHDIAPCVAVPPQDASRPNRHYRHDPDYGTYRAMREDGHRLMAEQVESTYDNEVQP